VCYIISAAGRCATTADSARVERIKVLAMQVDLRHESVRAPGKFRRLFYCALALEYLGASHVYVA